MDSVGLSKNTDELRTTRDQILRENSAASWAIFAYEGQSNNLKVAETGDDLEEGFQSLDASKIMYMYARVCDPNSSLPKFVLINWCGMGAPERRRAVCAAHIPEICRFLTKIHVTMNVRSEDELSVEALQTRVAKASGANYNAGASVQNTKPAPAPRPSNATGYVRPNAAAEIQGTRDKFWQVQEKEDEESRKAAELRRKAEVQARLAPATSAKPVPKPAPKPTASTAAATTTATAPTLSERERFWAQQEAEEQRRRDDERRKADLERQQRQLEVAEREKLAAARRDSDAAQKLAGQKARVAPVAIAATESHADPQDAARDDEERARRANVAKQARQQEIRDMMKARNTQAEVPDEALSKRADALRAQRQDEIRKLMSQRGNVDAEDEQHRQRAEELRQQREREMQEAFSKRSATFDEDEDARRKQADDARRLRQEELHRVISTPPKAVQASVVNANHKPSDSHAEQLSKPAEEPPKSPVETVAQPTVTPARKASLFDDDNQDDEDAWADNKTEKVQDVAKATEEPQVHTNGNHYNPPELQETPQDLYLNSQAASADESALYANQLVSNTAVQQPSQQPVGDSYEPINFGARRNSFRNANTEDDDHDQEQVADEPQQVPAQSSAENGYSVRALYEYEGQDEDEISFDVGELITEVQQVDSGWWYGTNAAGRTGMFPANYVEVI